ncbi:hypothetical protein WA026_004403 [Henosepilachna vigintioctopunctata]|uniref:Uncharacterized protein n=1 Tax=Henosepilachna vigintioctopunctata TaxID=420089 RepID=A0AAW1V7L2_9CUCU
MVVCHGYQVLYSHFKKAQKDKNRTTTKRAMYECLQNREATVVYADKLIRRSIAFFECLKEQPGTKTLEAKRAAITELKVLESNNWPPEKYVGYGEQEIEHLCARFIG